MIRKEIKGMVRNPVYFIIMILPIILTFIMSEGTQNYLSQHKQISEAVNTAKEIIIYQGILLNSKVQFAVSELNFMLMMYAILAGLTVFEEIKLHIWDRIVNKNEFILIKYLTHYGFSVFMIIFNMACFWVLFDIKMPIESIFIFLSVPIISILLGIFVGIVVFDRAMLSNTILMTVMMMGYFGGALSLTSVLANTKFMDVLMYFSPLTIANKLIFKILLNIDLEGYLLIWTGLVILIAGTFTYLIKRRIKYGAII